LPDAPPLSPHQQTLEILIVPFHPQLGLNAEHFRPEHYRKGLVRNRRTLITRSRGSRTVIRYSPNVLFGKVSRAGRFTGRDPSAKFEPNGFKNFCPAASMESWTGRPPQQRAVRHAGIPAGGILHSFGLFSKYKSGACRPTSHTPAFAPLMDMDFAIYWLRVFDFECSAKYSVGRMDTRNPGARPSPSEIGCSVNPGRSAVG
jgi:hypothetical protein